MTRPSSCLPWACCVLRLLARVLPLCMNVSCERQHRQRPPLHRCATQQLSSAQPAPAYLTPWLQTQAQFASNISDLVQRLANSRRQTADTAAKAADERAAAARAAAAAQAALEAEQERAAAFERQLGSCRVELGNVRARLAAEQAQ